MDKAGRGSWGSGGACEAPVPRGCPRAAARRALLPPLIAALLLVPAPSRASHVAQTAGVEGCANCHTSNQVQGEANTEGISAAARTLPTMRILNGGTPATFGCTFCHNSDANTVRMKGALSHFQGKPSWHPVGRDFVGAGGSRPGTGDTFNEFLGSADRQFADELDCVDCHDPLLVTDQSPANLALDAPYANHVDPADASRAENPFMLRDFADSDPGTFPDYSAGLDDFCRGCHGAAGQPVEGQDVRVASHGDTALLESDGTALRTSACADCHAPHFGSGYKLFRPGIDMGNATDCTNALCHERGDAADGFTTRGHGMAASTAGYPLGFRCSACHAVDARHDGSDDAANPAMLNYAEDPERSPFGKSVGSVCYVCHGDYVAHGAGVGCVDCHDEHAEAVGANAYMVPSRLPNNNASTETVVFASHGPADFDYYRGAGDGFCDNGVCHAGVTVPDPLGGAPIPIAPLANIMANDAHTGQNQAENSDCTACHGHDDAGGSWGAMDYCDGCHQSAGQRHDQANESAHRHDVTHAGTSAYVGGCSDCHPHEGTGALHNDGTVEFANKLGSALNYARAAGFGGGDCSTGNGCHGAPAGAWVSGVLACTDCHAGSGIGGGGNAPASGLHAVSAVTRHDASLLGGGCVNCHAAAGPSADHLDGTLDTPATAAFAFHANVVAYDRSAGCQAAGACHGGGDAGTWRRRWIGVVDAVPGTAGNDTPGQAVCQNCHGDFGGWRWNEAGATTTDHSDPYGGNGGDRMGEHDGCERCHGWGNAAYDRTWQTGNHGNGSIEMNGPDDTHGTAAGNQYNDATGGCAFACHSGAFTANSASGWSVAYGDYGLGDCGVCHGPGGPGPTVVWPAGDAAGRRTAYGSHLGATTAEEANGFLGGLGASWTAQCNKCHDAHGGAIAVPAPPASWADPSGRLSGTNMRTQLGLAYAIEANVAVHLGGTAQGGASEAEFCWGCHDANAVSEWGFNTKTTPAGYPVVTFATPDGTLESENHGWIYDSTYAVKTSDWTQGYWKSQYDALLARRVASMHTASFDPAGQSSSVAANVDGSGVVNRTAPTLEGKGYLRCSYCHDVHDTFGPGGKPYVRGTWAGNPYPAELPPRSAYAYTKRVNTGPGGSPTPRGLSTARDKGGYFIDQNSNWPTKNAALDTLAETAGLCALCHGSAVDTMDFYGGAKLWLPATVNGHSNSCLGGTGANKRDLFTGTRYGCGMAMQACVPWYGGCDANYPQYACSPGWCVPNGCNSIVNSGWYWGSGGGNPVGTLVVGGGDYANWYGVGTIGGAEGAGSKAHAFTCSKCHSPHATGLPALLTQNCIDPALGSFTTGGRTGTNLVAANCHRKTSAGDGWHVLAPAQ